MALILFTGKQGAGKTMLAVVGARKAAVRRRAFLISNIQIARPDGIDGIQLAKGRDGFDADQLDACVTWCRDRSKAVVIVLDELGMLMPARKWQNFPLRLQEDITQSRKMHVDMFTTSQYENLVDVNFRLNAHKAYRVSCVPGPSLESYERGRRPWFFRLVEYQPGHVGEKSHRMGSELIRYRREWEGFYDTEERVGIPERLRDKDEERSHQWLAWAEEVMPGLVHDEAMVAARIVGARTLADAHPTGAEGEWS